MSLCKECGATLPENSRYCLQCGTEATGDAGPNLRTQAQPELDFLKPALAGGLALGILSSIPIVNFANCICCLWVLAGGGLTAYLLNQQRPGRLTYGDGAFGGVIAGLVGAVVATIISIPVTWIMAGSIAAQRAQMETIFNQNPDIPPAFRSLFEQLMSGQVTAIGLLFGFIINALLFGLFAMIGGILVVALLNRKRPAD
jgi:hypothetical protein